MRWPFRKLHSKGKRRISQKQAHRANVHRELRGDRRRYVRHRKT